MDHHLFVLPSTLSQLRCDAGIPEYSWEDVVTWLACEERSKVLRVMLDEVVKKAADDHLLPETKWVELVSRMTMHPSLLLACALALACRPNTIDWLHRQNEGGVSNLEDPFRRLLVLDHEGNAILLLISGNTSVIFAVSLYEKVIAPMLVAHGEQMRARQIRDHFLPTKWGILAMSHSSREQQSFERERFVAGLLRPQQFRVIDCQQSLEKGVVVLVDWHPDIAYTAISHTYGMDVYKVYDCGCATIYMGDGKARANPAETPCHGHHGPDQDKQTRVMDEMLKMCKNLVEKGGVRFAWHDGICIAQYDLEDVKDAIAHMGWIYGNAESTVIFLNYAGQPMAPIGTGSNSVQLVSRWHTRAWTFQEAVLSKRRRYCVRRSGTSLGSCSNWEDFEDKLALWYDPGHSTIEIVDELDFFHSILLLITQMTLLEEKVGRPDPGSIRCCRIDVWKVCLELLIKILESGVFFNVTLAHALGGSASRDSKHPGDHINSILALAGVPEFSVPKDERVEECTLDFFDRMGKRGLEFAVFTTNTYAPPSFEECAMHRLLTWLPSLCGNLRLELSHFQDGGTFYTSQIEFEILKKNSHIKLTGPLVCVPVRFYWKKSESHHGQCEAPRDWLSIANYGKKEVAECLSKLHGDPRVILLCQKKSKSQNKEREAAESSGLPMPVMFAWIPSRRSHFEREAAESSPQLVAASVETDISKLAELHSPDDGLDVFLQMSPTDQNRKTRVASEFRTGGKQLGHAEFPFPFPPYYRDTIKDEKTLMEFSNSTQDSEGKGIRGIIYDEESDDADVYVGDAGEITVKTMDWREAWAYYYLSHEWPFIYHSWGETMRKLLCRRTEVRDALTQCGKHDFSGLMLRLQEFFEFPTVPAFVEADTLQRYNMGSFCASLVFPAEVLSGSGNIVFQCLVLNGDCGRSPVTKIGGFTGFDSLRALLVGRNCINAQNLKELEIC